MTTRRHLLEFGLLAGLLTVSAASAAIWLRWPESARTTMRWVPLNEWTVGVKSRHVACIDFQWIMLGPIEIETIDGLPEPEP